MNPGRIKFLLLGAVFAAPVLLSYATYFFWKPEKVGNYGDLLNPPLEVADFVVRDKDGKPFPLKSLGGKWLIVHMNSGACEAECQKKLFTMHQAHVALGKNQDRVRRVFLADDRQVNSTGADDIVWLDAAGTELQKKMPFKTHIHEHIYLVDPLGNVFMRYAKDAEIKGIVKDLERVLKISTIG